MDFDPWQLPIPDWDLHCPQCRYELQGLPTHRCPECGLELDMPALMGSWARVRDPKFTGRELPIPDFGIACRRCNSPLAGVQQLTCPTCDSPFDLESERPPREWYVLSHAPNGIQMAGVQALLARERVPHMEVKERTMGELYFGQGMVVSRLRVPSEFYFEVLWLLRQLELEMEAARSGEAGAPWRCGGCGEESPGHFDVCWNCGGARVDEGAAGA